MSSAENFTQSAKHSFAGVWKYQLFPFVLNGYDMEIRHAMVNCVDPVKSLCHVASNVGLQ